MNERIAIADGGWLEYHRAFYSLAEAETVFRQLLAEIPWAQETGRFGPFPRLTAWYADDGIGYSYSGVTHHGLPWTPLLSIIRKGLEPFGDFNSVLLNRYRSGQDSMGFHADDEKELGRNPVIASLSFGAVRRFRLKHNTSDEALVYDLAPGSLLIMGGSTQHHWKHALPKTAKPVGERINLTFRVMKD